MSRYCQALLIGAVSVLMGCGGGTTSPNSSPGGNGNSIPGALEVSTSAMAFGNVALGSSATQTGMLTAASSPVTVSSASWNGDGFSVSGITFPVSLTVGQSASFTVTFTPQASGAVSGGISFLSNASNSPTAAMFTGTGSAIQSPGHSVSLSWSASPSTVIGYNVYRGTTSGGPYPVKLTPIPQLTTSMVDGTVLGGTTYYYVATSVDQNSVESVYSNQLTATVP
jgi:Abnormal spindle-like microcephaly-assoc'd, ASPM-SPD-2-Hydin